MGTCKADSGPDATWDFCPNIGADYLYIFLFAITTIVHFVQTILYRKPYSLVITISGALQTTAYITRLVSIENPTSVNIYATWFVLIMVAPIWTNAYAYMVLGRMVYNFTPNASIFKVKAWRFGTIFVLLDVLAFFVQAGGAIMASGNDESNSSIESGIHIYMGGIAFQQICIFVFLGLAVRFQLKMRQQPESSEKKTALRLLHVEYAAVLLITARIIFRLIEYSHGITSSIPRHEVYQYIFDSTLMLIALVLFNVFHPGRLMPGAESNLPSHKERKSAKRMGQPLGGRMKLGDDNALSENNSTTFIGAASWMPKIAGYEAVENPSTSLLTQPTESYHHGYGQSETMA